VFPASLHDNQDLYLEDLGTGKLTRITRDPAPDGVPTWSPDGSRLAFVRFAPDGSSRIHVMDADGAHDHLLTPRALASEISPSWSADGRRLVFASITGNGGAASATAIYSIAVDGTDLRRLTNGPDLPNDPVWSPDGSHIAFDVGDPSPRLCVMDPSGAHRRCLTRPDAKILIDWPLLWSPDGSRLAFSGAGTQGRRDVYVIALNGNHPVDLTGDSGAEGAPAWSPDGRQLAFWSDREGGGDLYVVDQDGGGLRRLTTSSRLSGITTLAWSPDGTQLIVWNSPEGSESVNYVVEVAGGGLHRLTKEPGDESLALWRP
jgi:TolB protein